MKRLLLSICLLLVVMLAWAKPVDYETAMRVAENFAISQRISVAENPVVNLASEGQFRQMYIFGFYGIKGFVVVAADDRVIPILGYSTTTEFPAGDMPENVKEWFDDYTNQIDFLVSQKVEPTVEVQREWLTALNQERLISNPTSVVVGPLITTTWNQGTYYNALCPLDNGTRSYTGCTATAMSQVMKYWNHPTTGRGSHSYEWNSQTLSADFGNTTYNWSAMPSALTSSSTSAEKNAVATLIYHVGVSVDMGYSASGSGAAQHVDAPTRASAETSLQNYFGYSNGIRSINYADVTDAHWKYLLRTELDASRVMMYEGYGANGGGHSFICDGYDSNNNFHFNWGWGGSYDGYFAIGVLNPGGGGAGSSSSHSYNLYNSILIGIQPAGNTPFTSTVVTATPANAAHGSVTGSGTYNPYDTITLVASANEGYVFDRWDDYDPSNPRYVFATSPTFNAVANYKTLPTDTMHYCGDELYSSYGYTSGTHTTEWGFRYPASSLVSNRSITSVRFMPVVLGQYSVKLYQGDNSQMTLAYTQQFTASAVNAWMDIPLTTSYSIDTTSSLWVIIEFTGSGYTWAYSSKYCGNTDGMMFKSGSNWVPFKNLVSSFTGSWLVKAVTEQDTITPTPPTPADTVNVVCTEIGQSFYSSDNDLYITMQNDDYRFYFDIFCDQGMQDINDGKIYTLADMWDTYSFGAVRATSQLISYQAVSLMRTNGMYDIYVTASDNNIYHVTYTPAPEPLPYPKDTVYLQIDNKATCQVADVIATMNAFQLIGTDANNEYTLYFAIQNTSSIPGTYVTSDVYQYYTFLKHDADTILIDSLLPNAVVTAGTLAGSYNALIHYVGTDSVLYEITYSYSDPVPTTQKTFTANNLTISKNPISDTYYQYYGLNVYDFAASNGTDYLRGYIFTDDSPYGTYPDGDNSIDFGIFDVNGNRISNSNYSYSLTFAQTPTSSTLTGTTLTLGDILYTFNVTGAPGPKDTTFVNQSDTICQGDEYIWRGRTLTETGIYRDTVLAIGHDTIFVLNLTVRNCTVEAPVNLVATNTGRYKLHFEWENPTIGTDDEQANNFTWVISKTAVDPDTVKATKFGKSDLFFDYYATNQYETEYHFYVKNVSRGVSSAWTETTITTLPEYAAVQNLRIEGLGNRMMYLSWDKAQYAVETMWRVVVTDTATGEVAKDVVAGTNTNFRVTGLSDTTVYHVDVYPRASKTKFGYVASLDTTTFDKIADPINVEATITGTRAVTFTWQNGSAGVDPNNFSFIYRSGGNIDPSRDKYNYDYAGTVTGVTDTFFTKSGIAYNTGQYFYVKNMKGLIESDWVKASVRSLKKYPPVDNLHADYQTNTSLTAVWARNPFGTEKWWKVEIMDMDSVVLLSDEINATGLTDGSYTFNGLTRGTYYILRVTPKQNSTTYGVPATKKVKTLQTCEAPINVSYTNPEYRAYTFTWENPTLGTSEVEPNNFSYILRPATDGPVDPSTINVPDGRGLTDATLSVTKLSKGKTYYFFVRNEYDGAVSAWSTPIVFTVPATRPSGMDEDDDNDFIAEEVAADAFVNMSRLYVENLIEGVDVTIIDAAGRTIFNDKADNTHIEFDLSVRGVYMVVIRGEQEQILKVVY